MHLKLQKERDFYRMHHKRIVQEKDKLIGEIKRFVAFLLLSNSKFAPSNG